MLRYFSNKLISGAEFDEQERYRSQRKGQGAADVTINFEIGLLCRMYNMALKRKKIPIEMMPGEFVRKGESVPRRKVTEGEFEGILKHSNVAC